MNLNSFFLKHSVVSVGIPIPGKIEFSDVIVDSTDGLISLLGEHYYISQITWWDRVLISEGSKIGYGGPRDPRDPNKYFFAETDICRQFNSDTQPFEYDNYINEVRDKYTQYDLYPSFDIAIK